MNADVIARTVKAAGAVLAVIGIQVAPDQVEAITSGAVALYAVVSAIQAYFAK